MITQEQLEFLDDDGKLKRRFYNKRANAKKEGGEFSLTYDEYCYLVFQAGCVSSDLGFHVGSKKMVMARYKDVGNYVFGNCRIISQAENAREKQMSDANRISASKNIRTYNLSQTFEQRSELQKKVYENLSDEEKKKRYQRLCTYAINQPRKVSDEQIRTAYMSEMSIKQLCEKLGLSLASKNYERIRKVLKI